MWAGLLIFVGVVRYTKRVRKQCEMSLKEVILWDRRNRC